MEKCTEFEGKGETAPFKVRPIRAKEIKTEKAYRILWTEVKLCLSASRAIESGLHNLHEECRNDQIFCESQIAEHEMGIRDTSKKKQVILFFATPLCAEDCHGAQRNAQCYQQTGQCSLRGDGPSVSLYAH